MNEVTRFDSHQHTIGIERNLVARRVTAQADPPIAVDGMTFGVAVMQENSPHGGEMHPDGDEVLFLISGAVNIVFEDATIDDVSMQPGDGVVIPKGLWHRVDILAPSQIVYLAPGPGGEYRPL